MQPVGSFALMEVDINHANAGKFGDPLAVHTMIIL
jgi:hypothetical protein